MDKIKLMQQLNISGAVVSSSELVEKYGSIELQVTIKIDNIFYYLVYDVDNTRRLHAKDELSEKYLIKKR